MKKTIAELRLEATKKGIAFDGRWGKKKLKELLKDSVAHTNMCHSVISSDSNIPKDEASKGQMELFEKVDLPVLENTKVKLKNISNNRYEIFDLSMNSMEVVELSYHQLENIELMKRINRHVEIKKFKFVE